MKPTELRSALDRMIFRGGKYPPKVLHMITNDLNKNHPMTAQLTRPPPS